MEKKFSDLAPESIKNGVAKIIVYKPDRITGSGDHMDIFLNNRNVATLKPLGYKIIAVPIGKNIIHTYTSGIDRKTELDIKKGEVIFLKTVFSNYVLTGAWDLVLINEESAKKDLANLRESTP